MAYDDSQDQIIDDDQPNNQQQGQTQTTLSGGGSGFAGQGGSTPSSTSGAGSYTAKPSSSGNWTNLNSYLDANSDQAPAIGQGIANAVGTQAGQAQSDLGAVQTGFQNQTPYSSINSLTPGSVDSTLNASNYAAGQDDSTAENLLNDNWGITPTNSDITQYAGTSPVVSASPIINGTSTATPASTTPGWNTVQNDYTTANQNLQDTQSESGRDTLLQNQYGQNGTQYNQGEQNFDQLLLEQNPTNQATLNSVYNQYAPGVIAPTASSTAGQNEADAGDAGLSPDLYNAMQSAAAYNTNEQNLASGYQTQANTDLTNQISGLGAHLSNEVAADQANYNNQYSSMQQALASGQLTQQQAAQLGITSDFTGIASAPGTAPGVADYLHDYDSNPLSYLSQNANPYASTSPGQAADAASTAGDWNNYTGLQALLAGDTGSSQATDLSNLNADGLTGTQAQAQAAQATIQPAYAFNNTNFEDDLQQQNSAYSKGYGQQIHGAVTGAETQAQVAAWQAAQGWGNTLSMLSPSGLENGSPIMQGSGPVEDDEQ